MAHALREAHLLDGVPVVADGGAGAVHRAAAARRCSGRCTPPACPPWCTAEDLPLHLQPAVAPLLLLLRCALEPDRLDEEAAVALLHSPLGGADPLAERRLRQGLRALALAGGDRRPSGELLVEALRDPAGAGRHRAALGGAGAGGGRAAGHRPGGRRPAGRDRRGRALGGLAGQRSGRALGRRDQPGAPGGRRGRPARRRRAEAADRDLDAVLVLFDAAARFTDRLPGARTEVFLDHVLGQDLPADTIAPTADRGEAVRLLTAHAAKGLEWDLVAVAGVQEGIWPDLRLRGSLLGSERLVDVLAGRSADGGDRGDRGRSDLGAAGRGAPAVLRRRHPGPAPAAGQRRGVGRRRRRRRRGAAQPVPARAGPEHTAADPAGHRRRHAGPPPTPPTPAADSARPDARSPHRAVLRRHRRHRSVLRRARPATRSRTAPGHCR